MTRSLALVAFLATVGLGAQPARVVDLVNPLIDTHKSRWIYFSSASRPFAMVNLSPDTKVDGDWGSGYIYDEPYIRCFSHIHAWQMAGVPVMPVVGRMNGHEGYEAYKSPFSHSKEVARPGYHKVVLENSGVIAELTSTNRVGFHRYTFPASEQAYVLIDNGAPLGMTKMQDAQIRKTGERSLAGSSTMAPTTRREKPVTVYFVAEFDRPIAEFGGWEAEGESKKVLTGVDGVRGAGSGGYVRFRFTEPTKLGMKVALSYVSEEQARQNLAAELPGWDFDGTTRAAGDEWNDWLGKIRVEGGTEKQRVKFYTDLWHALLGRRAFSDADGSYIDNTGSSPQVRRVPVDGSGKPVRATYNSDAFWGTQWNLNVLWSLAYPKVMSDMASTLIDYYRNGGMIARGPAGGNYTFVMTGDPATPLIAAAYNKGIRDFDVEAAWLGCCKNAFPGGIRDRAGYEFGPNPQGGGMNYYVERGYVPLGVGGKGFHREGAGQTMEYAFQDWALGQFATALGKREDAAFFLKRSSNWKNLFDPSVGWIRPRMMDGSWQEGFQPVCSGFNCRGFVESNSAIYTYYVPQDMPGLIEAVGGRAKFVQKLNAQFEKAAPLRYVTPHGKHSENWVDYENQPSCHLAHLFSHAGAPWLTQYWVRRVKEEAFGDTSAHGGYNGDEDEGQMGGLGVLMAIGLFDIQGGADVEPRYEITSPLFDRISIQLDSRYYPGKVLNIVTRKNSATNLYIQSARWNGRPLNDRFWLTHAEVRHGGTLELEMGPQPDKRWGVRP
jgi:predicted alpha-1,2-mannosidase